MLCPYFHQHIQKTPTPIAWNQALGAWTVCGYQEVLSILKDNRFSAASANATLAPTTSSPSPIDPSSAHTEFIQSIQKQGDWTLEQIIVITKSICKSLENQKAFDIQSDLITPCCEQLALQLIGIEANLITKQLLLEAAQQIFLDHNSQAATIELSKFFLKIIPQKQQSSTNDFWSILLKTNQNPAILLSPIIQMFVGITTSLPLLLGNIVFALLSNPLEKEKYVQNPSAATNELLRYAGPVQIIYRLALDKVTIGGHIFERGDRIALLLAHANYDVSQFINAEKLDLDRNAVAHLALGKGAHSCLGTPIIRTAIEWVPRLIFDNFPSLEIDTKNLDFGGSQNIIGIKHFPIFVI